MANSSASNSASGSSGSHQDRALAEMINGLKEESINRGATALMDKEVDSFGSYTFKSDPQSKKNMPTSLLVLLKSIFNIIHNFSYTFDAFFYLVVANVFFS